MSTFISGLVVVLTILALCLSSLWAVVAWDERKNRAVAYTLAIVMWSAFFGLLIESEKQYPCIQYETQMHYDAALKMTRPMKVCVERGGWVE